MKITVLAGSPRNVNTTAMVEAFKEEYEDGTVWQHGVVRVIVKVEQKEM